MPYLCSLEATLLVFGKAIRSHTFRHIAAGYSFYRCIVESAYYGS